MSNELGDIGRRTFLTSKKYNRMIVARVKSDFTSMLSNRAILVSCRAKAYSLPADYLKDGEFLATKSIANPTEAMPANTAQYTIELSFLDEKKT